eukprot:UN02211
MSKIVKAKGQPITALEQSVAKAISEIQLPEVAEEVKTLNICSVKEVQVSENKKAYVIFIQFRQQKRVQKIQKRLIVEIEKKFPNTHVLIVAQRTVMSENMARWTNQKRAHSRTLTAVHNAILDDIVAPSTIVGKRIRFKTDGSQLLKVFVDKKDSKDVEEKLATFAKVYQKLTARNVVFQFQ